MISGERPAIVDMVFLDGPGVKKEDEE